MFVVLVVHTIPEHLRGYIGRILTQPATSVYVGIVSHKVADELWQAVCAARDAGYVIMVRSSDSECGYTLQAEGVSPIQLADFDDWILPVRNRI
jgi:CRISPR-associated endoribonuclease Cas2 subtype I-E